MIAFVNAKINIGLNIVSRRPDGYHNLNTIFYPVGKLSGTPEHPSQFADIIEIVEGNEEFLFTGRKIDVAPEKNLVVKAYRLFSEELKQKGIPPTSFRLMLDKHLPDGAGMGGGSADASFTLKLLNELYDNPFSQVELLNMAARLGADCPFFIINTPCYAEGTGECLTPITPDLSQFRFLIVKPDVYVSTAEAFAWVTPHTPAEPLSELIKLPVEQWQGRIVNDFEPGIIRKHPVIGQIKSLMLENGAVYASMTGSGSALYALFPNDTSRDTASGKIAQNFHDALLLRP